MAGEEGGTSEKPKLEATRPLRAWPRKPQGILLLPSDGQRSSQTHPDTRERKEILLPDERNHPRAHRLGDNVAGHLRRQSTTLSNHLGKG